MTRLRVKLLDYTNIFSKEFVLTQCIVGQCIVGKFAVSKTRFHSRERITL